MERRKADRRHNRLRIASLYLILLLLGVLCGLSLYGAFIVSPDQRDEIEATAHEAKATADALAESNAGLTALICTGSNRHDAIDTTIIKTLGTDDAALSDALNQIPPATNCGELICQFFRAIDEPGALIEIRDPHGPNRPREPCGPAPTQP
jgi:hypothetical protein